MNFINNKHDYSIKSKEVYSSEKRTQIEKNHEEAEAEEYLKAGILIIYQCIFLI